MTRFFQLSVFFINFFIMRLLVDNFGNGLLISHFIKVALNLKKKI